jgi:hypothetical protein
MYKKLKANEPLKEHVQDKFWESIFWWMTVHS